MTEATKPTIIIGAGIIGAAIAYEVQRRGQNVILVERNQPGRGASFGNMASIAIDGFGAISRPSTWKNIPFWLMDPLAPVSVDPFYVPRMIPWLWRFLMAGTKSRISEIEAAGASMATRVHEDLLPMLKAIGAQDMLSDKTCLSIFGSETEFRQAKESLDRMARFGLEYEILTGRQITNYEPQINANIHNAVLLPQNHFIADPYQLVLRLIDALKALGGEIRQGEVTHIERDNGNVSGVWLENGEVIEGSRVVIAAGVASRAFCRDLGESIPLETERGYHTQIMEPDISLSYSIIWPHRAFMITPTAGGIRIGGSVEMAGLNKLPDYRRARILVDHAKYVLPDLKVGEASEWMGHRPALPDTIPVISQSAKTGGVFYATGHGHLGLTYAATTARLLADLMTGITPPIDMRPFRIERF